jgi:NTP pyrophosphatase (non-canonical NTP hydrolase)
VAHFETIWNEAESVSKSYTDLKRKDIFREIRKAIDDLADAEESEDLHEALGDILFGLCSLCAHLEDKKSVQVNSATALVQAIERKRAELLDPEPPE